MKLLKRVNRLIGQLGLTPRDERPLDFQLTQEDVEAELHYPRPASPEPELRVAFVDAAPKP